MHVSIGCDGNDICVLLLNASSLRDTYLAVRAIATGVYIWGRGRAAASCPALSSSPAFAAVESSPSEPDPPVKVCTVLCLS